MIISINKNYFEKKNRFFTRAVLLIRNIVPGKSKLRPGTQANQRDFFSRAIFVFYYRNTIDTLTRWLLDRIPSNKKKKRFPFIVDKIHGFF